MTSDNVNHPKHYNNHPSGVECITITEHMNFNLGNVIKYIWRTDHKNGLEDLKKAKWYLEREIQRLSKPVKLTAGEGIRVAQEYSTISLVEESALLNEESTCKK